MGVEEGEIEFGSLAEAAGVVAAAPFGGELLADAELWVRYVAEVERHLAETAGDALYFRPRDGVGPGDLGSGGEGTVLALPALAYFGHATAPWN